MIQYSFPTMNKSLTEFYREVRSATEKLTSLLNPEDTVIQPVGDVSPPKWHLAHTSWFFEQFVLTVHNKEYKVFHPDYKFYFNSYYEEVGERVIRDQRGFESRPLLKEIMEYRKYVDLHMIRFMSDLSSVEVKDLIVLGLNHEQQHQELLVTDIKFILGKQPFFPPYFNIQRSNELTEQREAEWLEFDEGLYEIGHSGNGFAFDNESKRHKVFLYPFRISDQPVTNAEWLEFMGDGGYGNFRHWLSDGWEWVKKSGAQAPEFWHEKDGQWFNYTMYGLEPVDTAAPVTHINFYEADAFARWSGYRLPSEHEWEVAATEAEPEINESKGFLESGVLEPEPLSSPRFSGNVWEWTNSAYLAYPFYKQSEGALGEYNGKWMSGQMVLRGGSCATPKSHYRHTYRNFFQPEKRWQFTGLRLAQYI